MASYKILDKEPLFRGIDKVTDTKFVVLGYLDNGKTVLARCLHSDGTAYCEEIDARMFNKLVSHGLYVLYEEINSAANQIPYSRQCLH